jgi:hypothetical protein
MNAGIIVKKRAEKNLFNTQGTGFQPFPIRGFFKAFQTLLALFEKGLKDRAVTPKAQAQGLL